MYKVKVLMSTYNGEKYLGEQLESIFKQIDVEVSLLVRDDGSTDKTLDILNEWAENHEIIIVKGKNLGYAHSFMALLNSASGADYYAFADQDDVWLPKKLITAIDCMNSGNEKNHLYMSQAIIVDDRLYPIKVKFHKRYITLDRLIAHNFAIGCTMVFDDYLHGILKASPEKMELRAGHDYWISCVACAVGGNIYWDENGYVLYRQHGNNASGKIVSIRQAFRAIKKILYKWKHVRENIAKKILINYSEYISNDDKRILKIAAYYRDNFQTYLRFLLSKKFLSNYFIADVVTKISILICTF